MNLIETSRTARNANSHGLVSYPLSLQPLLWIMLEVGATKTLNSRRHKTRTTNKRSVMVNSPAAAPNVGTHSDPDAGIQIYWSIDGCNINISCQWELDPTLEPELSHEVSTHVPLI